MRVLYCKRIFKKLCFTYLILKSKNYRNTFALRSVVYVPKSMQQKVTLIGSAKTVCVNLFKLSFSKFKAVFLIYLYLHN